MKKMESEQPKKQHGNKLTTVAIYRSDLRELDKLMKKGEMYRDQIHGLILKEKESKK